MALATWWRGDSIPPLTPLANFVAGLTEDPALLAGLANLEIVEVQRRIDAGHRPYLGWINGEAVAYGWVATHTAHIGELDLVITLPQGDCYLWDFATLPDWRGRGIYPRLLQAILTIEQQNAQRFWIIAAPENRASSAGIGKAGFTSVAHLSFQRSGQPGLIPMTAGDPVAAAATLLQVPILEADPQVALSPCWHCAIDARQEGREVTDVACWPIPSLVDLTVTTCHCA